MMLHKLQTANNNLQNANNPYQGGMIDYSQVKYNMKTIYMITRIQAAFRGMKARHLFKIELGQMTL
jgi:hypothetical protein